MVLGFSQAEKDEAARAAAKAAAEKKAEEAALSLGKQTKEDNEKADAAKLRVGSYVTDQGAPRPFVYVPNDFDLGRLQRGARQACRKPARVRDRVHRPTRG